MRTSSGGLVSPSAYESGPLREVAGAAIRPGGLALTQSAIDYCRFAAGARVVDVGCGVGASVEHLRRACGLDATGIDISVPLITEGLTRDPSLPLVEASAEELPFAGETQDGVLCECVLSLLAEPRVAVSEFRRVLRSGGYLILSDLYARAAVAGAGQDEPARGVVACDRIGQWVSESGFTPLLWEDHTTLLREMAARLILAGGSIDQFFCTEGEKAMPPGYYLMVARKG